MVRAVAIGVHRVGDIRFVASARIRSRTFPDRAALAVPDRHHIIRLCCNLSGRGVGFLRKGLVVGVDIVPPSLQLRSNMRFVQRDILAWDTSSLQAIGGPFEVVLSDMSPSTTGNKFVDSHRSLTLSECALAIANRLLKARGVFVCKIFQGPEFDP